MATPQPPGDPNQQPQQSPPYGMQSGMQTPQTPPILGDMNFALLTQPQQRGFFIAGIAAVVVILGFFILPFYGVSSSIPSLVASRSYPASYYGGWLWLAFLCALAAGGLAVWRAVTTQTNVPPQLNRANATLITIILGGVSAFLLLIALLTTPSLSGPILGVTYWASWGGWIVLLAAIGIAVGGVMQRNTQS